MTDLTRKEVVESLERDASLVSEMGNAAAVPSASAAAPHQVRATNRFNSAWHRPGLTETFKELCAKGKSFAAMAGELSVRFGLRITRNSLIGKAKRLGISNGHDNAWTLAHITAVGRCGAIGTNTRS